MKLVEILARELNEWPVDESLPLRQANDDSLYVSAQHTNGKDTNYLDIFVSKSEDRLGEVTRAQWEAERARILAESQPDRDEFIKELVDATCGKRSQYEQELRDQVAARRFNSHMELRIGREYASREAFDDADAFMAERAKRLKGVK